MSSEQAVALQFMNLADILVDAFCNRFRQSPVCCERSERSMRKPAVILTLALAFQLTHCATAVAHEKWFHQGSPTNWSEVLESKRLAAISAVVAVTLIAAFAWRIRRKRDLLSGPEAFGATPARRSRFYAWVPAILALHVAVPLLVY